jgi:hypothetical protein
LNAKCKVKNAEFQPSLRDWGLSVSIPSLEKAGLFSFVPTGHKAANFRKAYRPALFPAEIGWREVTKLESDQRTRGLSKGKMAELLREVPMP